MTVTYNDGTNQASAVPAAQAAKVAVIFYVQVALTQSVSPTWWSVDELYLLH